MHPQGSDSQGMGRDRNKHLDHFYLISCPVLTLLICAVVERAELGTDAAIYSSSPLRTAKRLRKEPLAE